jgi:hypothetical protein
VVILSAISTEEIALAAVGEAPLVFLVTVLNITEMEEANTTRLEEGDKVLVTRAVRAATVVR